ncbi:hypothetical protein ElyMa_006954500 [Elysia marginata]|uniref:ETS domain-containing protein n=1 Tax=Elysia marginata TaxID=1093978 RepID=A0AAV4JLI4_9GAST|nr:hypothetical protein ElyMa_006954500 [Elysia marginata]
MRSSCRRTLFVDSNSAPYEQDGDSVFSRSRDSGPVSETSMRISSLRTGLELSQLVCQNAGQTIGRVSSETLNVSLKCQSGIQCKGKIPKAAPHGLPNNPNTHRAVGLFTEIASRVTSERLNTSQLVDKLPPKAPRVSLDSFPKTMIAVSKTQTTVSNAFPLCGNFTQRFVDLTPSSSNAPKNCQNIPDTFQVACETPDKNDIFSKSSLDTKSDVDSPVPGAKLFIPTRNRKRSLKFTHCSKPRSKQGSRPHPTMRQVRDQGPLFKRPKDKGASSPTTKGVWAFLENFVVESLAGWAQRSESKFIWTEDGTRVLKVAAGSPTDCALAHPHCNTGYSRGYG